MNTVGWVILVVAVLALIVLGLLAAAYLDRVRARRVAHDLPERTHGYVAQDEVDSA